MVGAMLFTTRPPLPLTQHASTPRARSAHLSWMPYGRSRRPLPRRASQSNGQPLLHLLSRRNISRISTRVANRDSRSVVSQKQGGIVDERPGNRHAASDRPAATAGGGSARQARRCPATECPVAPLRCDIRPCISEWHEHVVERARSREQVEVLEHEADFSPANERALVGRKLRYVLAVEPVPTRRSVGRAPRECSSASTFPTRTAPVSATHGVHA